MLLLLILLLLHNRATSFAVPSPPSLQIPTIDLPINPSNYLLFSDLHLSPSTLPQCTSLLHHLRSLTRPTPSTCILFLGDFYHSRGSIPVECLNAVFPLITSIALNNPIVMIPGNHDIVDFNNLQTSIDVFSHIPNVTVVKDTSVIRNAGFVPYKRSGIVQDLVALGGIKGVDSVFVHDDVKGGVMTGRFRSRKGLGEGDFKGFEGKAWSGHYHKPQDVGGVSYVGSGYQVSAGESSESKRFVWLDSSFNYVRDEVLPRFGREYHYGLKSLDVAREGDVVIVEVEEGEEGGIKDEREEAERIGVELRVKIKNGEGEQRGDIREVIEGEGRSQKDLLKEYVNAAFNSTPSAWVENAVQILDNVTEGETPFRERLDFQAVEVEGFASFEDRTIYPLSDRGVVLVKGGGIVDGKETSSNGAGKTSLLMSAFWAVTGTLDPRPTVGESVNDVINNKMDRAEVNLDFEVGGKRGRIERSKGKKGGLTLSLDSTDKTFQTVKQTQDYLSELLPPPTTLQRCVFLNQHMAGDLLSSTAGEFAGAVGGLAGIDVFAKCRKLAGDRVRDFKREREGIERVVKVRMGDKEGLDERVKGMKGKIDELQNSKHPNAVEMPTEIDVQSLYGKVTECESTLSSLQSEIETSADIQTVREAISLNGLMVDEARTKLKVSSSALSSALKRMEATRPDEDKGTCPTCGQNIEGDSKARVVEFVRKEEEEVGLLRREVEGLEEKVGGLVVEGLGLEEKMREIMVVWEERLGAAKEELRVAREAYQAGLGEESRFKSEQSKRAERDKELDFLRRTLESDCSNRKELESELQTLNSKVAACFEEEAKWAWAEKVFGPRGVQAYVLTSALKELSYLTSNYLSSLSSDTLRLKLTMGENGVILRSVSALEKTVWGKRTLATLSGGQWRRVSLALMLGFRELCWNWGVCRSNILVMDEPMTHLDRSGRRALARVLKEMIREGKAGTVFLILQDLAGEEMEEDSDEIDIVWGGSEGGSKVIVDS